jgi:hypothetical protein
MQVTLEDARIAATMKTTLSGALIAGVFAVAAVEAVLVVFVVDKREKLAWFAVTAFLAAIALTASAVFGAWGITQVYKPEYEGRWMPDAGQAYFSGQALIGFLGLFLLILCAFLGQGKPEAPKEPPEYEALKATLVQLQKDVVALQALKAQPPAERPAGQNKKPKKH